MPQAVFHILAALIIADLIRDHVFRKKHFPLHLVLVAGIGGILPDIDVFFWWVAQMMSDSAGYVLFHRTYTHSLFFMLLFLIPAFICYDYEKGRWRKIFLMISLGVFIHLMLDAIFQGTIMPLYPLSDFAIGLNLYADAFAGTIAQGVDAILLVLWLVYIEWRHRISDFI